MNASSSESGHWPNNDVPRSTTSHGIAACLVFSALPVVAAAQAGADVEEVVVTATARPESLSRVVGTVEVIGAEDIERSSAKSLTELLSENASAFLSEWSPGQTQINLRGGASDGQGRDFRSQVLVLVNGRRAGTANISKLAPASVSRIEIVRGPASVVYGSQNIGGVVNIITKTGRTGSGGSAQLSAGSWGFLQGDAQMGDVVGNFDWFLSASASSRDDYDAGKGGDTQYNTAWKRRGATGEIGYQFNPRHAVEFTLRTDGIYDAGFRGGTAAYQSQEDRYNSSFDAIYRGELASERVAWTAHAYAVQDIDDLRWAAPVVRGSNGQPTAGTSQDYNRREIEIVGSHLQPRTKLWEGNDLLVGWDFERSTVRSTRERVGVNGAPISQIPPYDNNQTETVHALYVEDSQSFFDERLTLRGGLRWTGGETSFDPTPNLAGQLTGTEEYETTTWGAGLTFGLTERIRVRAGIATGFRAPNATELGADFTSITGSRTFGNPNLEPENSEQVEVGINARGTGWRTDVAVFRNLIKDRIVTVPRPNAASVSDYANNPGDVEIEGIELQSDFELQELLNPQNTAWRWSFGAGGSYHWTMTDRGARATANTRFVERVYKYQGSFSTEVGRQTDLRPWSIRLEGVLHGPIWYTADSAGELLLVPLAQPFANFIHRKEPYWLVNTRAEMQVTKAFKAFVSVNNVLDKNYHPIFVGIDRAPYLLDPRFSNGGLGTSLPGREYQVGVRYTFGGK